MINLQIVLVLLSLGFLSACSTTSDEVSFKRIQLKDRFYVGQVRVVMNGVEAPKCELYLNLDISPSIKLAQDGFIFYKTDRENFKLKSIACLHSISNRAAAWHHQKLNLKSVSRPDDNSTIQYFGDIHIDWKIDPAQSVEASEKDMDSTGLVKVGHVKDSGEIRLKITADKSSIENKLTAKWPQVKEKDMKINESIVTIKKDE